MISIHTKRLRAAWRVIIYAIDPTRLVFVDECSTNTSLAPLYGWSPRGERVHQKAPRNWGKNMTLLASISQEGGVGACLSMEGSTTKEVFEAYLEQALCPTLERSQVVVMDNLSSHKGERVRELIADRGCELIYLPPYSPNFNPIEQAFSKIKNLLPEARAGVYEALVEAIGKALSAITSGDSQGFFEHFGYHAMDQSI